MLTARRPKMTEPLGAVTAFFCGLLLAGVAYGVAITAFGSGSFLGFGLPDWTLPWP